MSRVSVRESAVTLQFAVLACAEGCEENGSSNSYIYCRGAPLLSKSSALRLYSVRCLALRASSSLKTFLALGSNLNTLQNRRPNAKRLARLACLFLPTLPFAQRGSGEERGHSSAAICWLDFASLLLLCKFAALPSSKFDPAEHPAIEHCNRTFGSQPLQPTCSACG